MFIKPVPIWKEAPFLRLIIPFIPGIVVQWYLHVPVALGWGVFILALILLLLFQFKKTAAQFSFYWINGILLNVLLFFTGVLLTHYRDITHQQKWIGNYYNSGAYVTATIEEPLSEKENSFKALSSVQSVTCNDTIIPVYGSILIYFQKDSSQPLPGYGSQIVFKKALARVRNSGNPGAFDYQRYCAFQDIYHQVFLKPGEFIVLPHKKENAIKKLLFAIRSKTVAILQQYLHGAKEAGLAEALLIGYKDDLDKNLVQSYSNTGVVHIIAISGMQLALIYGFLILLFRPVAKFRVSKWLKPLTIIITLWLFSLLSGASASVLRAAVMFTCIVIGESLSKRTSLYNNLAASALLLLCYNPFWLWDTGFQLSYGAVLSIAIFMNPIYHLFHIQNKSVDFIWQLISVSLAAQVLTTPVSIFYFHQFPNYFLLTNLVAVPVSTIILFGELLLLAVAFAPFVAGIAGTILSWLIRVMNSFIEHIEHLPFSRWENLQINIPQLILLYAAIAGLSTWVMYKMNPGLQVALRALLFFAAIRSFSFWQASRQQKMIVYSVPQHQAIDFIGERGYLFKGDSILLNESFLQNFHLKPSRISDRLSETGSISSLSHGNVIFQFGTKRILIIDQPISFIPSPVKLRVDVIVLSKNPNLSISNLAAVFDCGQWVFDASNAGMRVSKWKQECAQLHLFCHDVVDKGAFVMNVD